MDQLRGKTAEPRNFLRVLRQIPEGTLSCIRSLLQQTHGRIALVLWNTLSDALMAIAASALGLIDMSNQERNELVLAHRVQDFDRFILVCLLLSVLGFVLASAACIVLI